MVFAPPIPVAPPAFTPRRYGLFSVAQMVGEESWEWRSGVVQDHVSEGCAPTGDIWVQPCPPDDPGDKTATSMLAEANGGEAFTVIAGAACSPVGITVAEWDSRAQARLLATEEATVELVLQGVSAASNVAPNFTGDQPSDGSFTAPTPTSVTGTTTAHGTLGALELALNGCYGGRGVIHVGPIGANAMAESSLLVRNGGVLETPLGNLVAVHALMAGDAMVATGAVAIRRSAVEMVGDFASSLDRDKNTVNRFAERTYVLTWDCCLLTTQIT